jgi:hypothetical protein
MKNVPVVAAFLTMATAAPAQAQAQPRELREATSRVATLVFVDRRPCVQQEVFAPLVALAAGFIGDLVTSYISQRLEARRAGLTGSWVANGVVELAPDSNLETNGRCLVVARGRYNGADLTREAIRGMNPDFYLEAQLNAVRVTPDPPAGQPNRIWTLAPVRVDYRLPGTRTRGRGEKHVSVVIAFSGTTPATGTVPADNQAIAVFRHNFGRLAWRSSYSGNILQGTASSQRFTAPGQVNVTALVTESEDQGPAEAAFVSAFNSNKDALSTLIENTIKDALGQGN